MGNFWVCFCLVIFWEAREVLVLVEKRGSELACSQPSPNWNPVNKNCFLQHKSFVHIFWWEVTKSHVAWLHHHKKKKRCRTSSRLFFSLSVWIFRLSFVLFVTDNVLVRNTLHQRFLGYHFIKAYKIVFLCPLEVTKEAMIWFGQWCNSLCDDRHVGAEAPKATALFILFLSPTMLILEA